MKSILLAVGFLFMVVLTACNGNEFIAFPSGADAARDDAAVPDHQVDDGETPDGRDAFTDDATLEVGEDALVETDAGQDVVAIDAAEDAEVGIDAAPDVVFDAAPDADFDAGAESICEQFGTDGKTTIIVKVAEPAPTGKVLGIFGKSTVYGTDGGTSDYEIWVQANDSDRLVVITTPIPAVTSAVLLFDPGYAEIGDTYFAGWIPLCPGIGCPDSSRIVVCRDKVVVGSINGTVPYLACNIQSNDWGWSEIRCILSAA